MAVDFRISNNAKARAWLEGVLLNLEGKGLLDVTRERRPPHYHVALFPDAYRTYVEGTIGRQAVATALLWNDAPAAPVKEAAHVQRASVETLPAATPARTGPSGWAVGAVALLAGAALFAISRQKATPAP